jgi:serine protease AprX
MPTGANPFRAAVYVESKESSETVETVLRQIRPDDVHVYAGMVEGWLTRDAFDVLSARGLAIDVLDPGVGTAGSTESGAEPPHGSMAMPQGGGLSQPQLEPAGLQPDREEQLVMDRYRLQVADFRAASRYVAIGPGDSGFVIGDTASEQRDPPIHAIEAEARPPDDTGSGAESGGVLRGRRGFQPSGAPPPPEEVYDVTLKGPISGTWRDALRALGLEILCHRPPATYQMFISADRLEQVRALPFIQDVRKYGFDQSISPDLVRYVAAHVSPTVGPGPSLRGRRTAADAIESGTFDAVCHRASDRDAVAKLLAGTAGVQVLDAGDLTVRFTSSLDRGSLQALLSAVAALPAVRTLTPYHPPKLLADHARRLVGIEIVNDGRPSPLDGSGELVAVFDSGLDAGHADLADRVFSIEAVPEATEDDRIGHGTHVAGIIAGTGVASGGAIRGAAPAARLVVVAIVDDGGSLQLPADLGTLMARATAKGAKVINLSWGTPIGGSYDAGSRSLDAFVHANPEVVVVVAAGNEGAAPQGRHRFNTLGTPASAKNVITVGATATDRTEFAALTWGMKRGERFPVPPASDEAMAGDPTMMAAISSRGPTDFESVKPDLVAPGTYILAPRASNLVAGLAWGDDSTRPQYVYIGGTSMAAPLVAGAAALVRQHLRDAGETAAPSAALVKGILVTATRRLPSRRPSGSAEDVGYPDFDQGFGILDLPQVIPNGSSGSKPTLAFVDVANDSPEALESRAQLGGPTKALRAYGVEVGPDPRALVVTLAWTDPPAVFVQNALRLDVTTPAGRVTIGNPELRYHRESMFDDPTPGGIPPDRRDNVQQVRFDAPDLGTYRIRVVALNTACPPQGYALVACGDLASGLEVVS